MHMQMKGKRGKKGEHTYHIILRTKSSSRVCGEIDRDLYNRSCVEIDTYEHSYELLSGVWIRLFYRHYICARVNAK